jgi:hypothetical protein
VIGGLAALAAAAGAAVLLTRGGERVEPVAEPPASAQPSTVPAEVSEPAPTSETTATPSAAPAPSAVIAPTSGVRLDVLTEPAGATLSKDGFQVCDETPCEVMADPNETLVLEAKKGALKGTAKVLAQRDQRVTIRLAAAARPKVQKPRLCEVEVDGLKILRPCK